ncbi:FAD-dependent oxidoreductase [Paracoccus sp. AS002]|uniref:oxidoreductase n=1 Tax=Paracoccus sp. AS002 TaxID=3019545 RepID=UPI0023E7C7D0|nr:FAD-dependent oxidoreductase [Paracoccus sp. AS002]MDF3904330.1 FAD-dependent oxidoreductase [Paracoccus sp. AS002]
MVAEPQHFPHIFRPLRIGGMQLSNRIMAPPHGRIIADPLASPHEAERFSGYWLERVRNGLCWVDGVNTFIDNRIVPRGYAPSGLGAILRGSVHNPQYRDRMARLAQDIHAHGAVVTAQIINQGAMPHSASGVLANYTNNAGTHALTGPEIARMIEDYALIARTVRDCGLDGIELHANHEDVLQLFLSPATNHRQDEYGGSAEGRLKLLTDVLAAIRAEAGRDLTIGIRFNMHELFEGGYDLDEGIAIARAIEATGHIDFFHGVIGNNWGAPSYIQPHLYGVAQWSEMAGRYRAALSVPVVYSGRVDSPEAAEAVLARGHADVVGVARGFFADPAFVAKARQGRSAQIVPCIGCNDCLHAVSVEKLPFGCAVNPRAGREADPPPARAAQPRRIVVVGAGPAGMEAAAVAAERGHAVVLLERAGAPGGQMRLAAAVPENRQFLAYIDRQHGRLRAAGVDIRLGTEADPRAIMALSPDVLLLATGSRPRRHAVPGAELPFVIEGRDLLAGRAQVGRRALVVAREDHMQPLTVASALVERGVHVRLLYQTPAVAPLVGKYSIGAIMARLTAAGAELRVMERVTAIAPGRVATRNVYSGAEALHEGFDSVVLACGAEPETALAEAMQAQGVIAPLLLGDAYVPGRILAATREAYEIASRL